MNIPLRLFSGCMLQMIPYAFISLYPFHRHFRFSKKKTFLSAVAMVALSSLLFALAGTFFAAVMPADLILWQSINGIFMLLLVLDFCLYLYFIKAIWQKKLFVFSFTITSALAITTLYNCIYMPEYLELCGLDAWIPYGGEFHRCYLLTVLIALPLLWLFLKYFYLPVEDGLDARESGFLSVISLLLSGLMAFGLSVADYNNLSSRFNIMFLFLALLITVFVVYFLFFKMYQLIREKSEFQQKTIQIQYENNLYTEQYRRIQEHIENNRKMRHDWMHHLIALRSFLDNGDPENALQYLDEYMKNTVKYEILRFCGNPVINMLVSHYSALAKEQGIEFTARILLPDRLSMQDTDLSVMLGNLLENAVTAADRASGANRYVKLNMICSGKMLAVTVDNGFDGYVKRDGERYLSTKENHSGIGMKSLEDISRKYNGGVEFSNDGVEFHASVMAALG